MGRSTARAACVAHVRTAEFVCAMYVLLLGSRDERFQRERRCSVPISASHYDDALRTVVFNMFDLDGGCALARRSVRRLSTLLACSERPDQQEGVPQDRHRPHAAAGAGAGCKTRRVAVADAVGRSRSRASRSWTSSQSSSCRSPSTTCAAGLRAGEAAGGCNTRNVQCARAQFDRNADGTLSFGEWRSFAEEDDVILDLARSRPHVRHRRRCRLTGVPRRSTPPLDSPCPRKMCSACYARACVHARSRRHSSRRCSRACTGTHAKEGRRGWRRVRPARERGAT